MIMESEDTGMYQLMMNLPLFNGVGFDKMSEILSFSRFTFTKHEDGETILRAGEPCTGIHFILRGRVRSTIVTRDARLAVAQTLQAPDVLSPDHLFGRNTLSPATVVADGKCATAWLSKADYLRILTTDSIFLFNLLNRLSKDAQKAIDGMLSLSGGTVEQRLALWIAALTDPSGVDITMEGRHSDVYTMFGVQRSVFIQIIQELENKGLLVYNPGLIKIIDRRKFIHQLLPSLEV